MATALTRLFVPIGADVADLQRKLAAAGKSFESFGKEIENAASSWVTQAASLAAIAAGLREAFRAADQFDASQRTLAATAKITGQNIGFLQTTAQGAQKQFGLSASLAGDLTVELTKLAGKAGDVGKASAGLAAFLDLGAARGLNAEETLTAVRQAILGIDEGTDKLFNKNPSVLYAEFAATIGKTATSLTDTEKAQAILSAAFKDGGKVAGEYAKFLKSPAGAAFQLQVQLEQTAASIGKSMQAARMAFLPVLASMAEGLRDFVGGIQVMGAEIATIPARIELAQAKLSNFIFGGRNIGGKNVAGRGPGGAAAAERLRAAQSQMAAYQSALDDVKNDIVKTMDLATQISGPTNPLQSLFSNVATAADEAKDRIKGVNAQLQDLREFEDNFRIKTFKGRTPSFRDLAPNTADTSAVDKRFAASQRAEIQAFRDKVSGSAPSGNGPGFFEQFKQGLTGGITDIVSKFGPLAAAAAVLAPVFQGLSSVVGPILTEPLRLLGELIGTAILPVVKLLAVPLRLLNVVVSYVVEGLGWFIEALGNFVDKIVPDWISKAGKGLAQLGRDMQDSARAARRNSDATDEATDAAERLAESLRNVPSGFKIQKRRFESTIGVSPANLPTATPRYTFTGDIHVHEVEDPKGLTDAVEAESRRRVLRGGGGLTLSYAP